MQIANSKTIENRSQNGSGRNRATAVELVPFLQGELEPVTHLRLQLLCLLNGRFAIWQYLGNTHIETDGEYTLFDLVVENEIDRECYQIWCKIRFDLYLSVDTFRNYIEKVF